MFHAAMKGFQVETFARAGVSSRISCNGAAELVRTGLRASTSTYQPYLWRAMAADQFDEVIFGPRLRAAVVVAHPDDEILWCGGYILAHPEFDWRIVTLCRESDPDRAPKFRRVLEQLGAVGAMADLDDEPEQLPLANEDVEETILALLAGISYGLILTHGPRGEYTRHLRHEECSQSVV